MSPLSFIISWGDNSLVIKSLMQALDRRYDNQSVITREVDNTFEMCICLFRGSGNIRYYIQSALATLTPCNLENLNTLDKTLATDFPPLY